MEEVEISSPVSDEPEFYSEYVILVDGRTGEPIAFAPERRRLSHMRRRLLSWWDVMKPYWSNKDKYRVVGIRLSDVEWEPRHVSEYLHLMRERLGERLVGDAFVLEMTERAGVPHYHLVLIVRHGSDIPKPDEPGGGWTYGSSRIETWHDMRYLVRYCGKEKQKEGLPKGAHIFGVWFRGGMISAADIERYRMSLMPDWLIEEVMVSGYANRLAELKYRKGHWVPVSWEIGGYLIAGDGLSAPHDAEWEPGGWIIPGDVRFQSPYRYMKRCKGDEVVSTLATL